MAVTTGWSCKGGVLDWLHPHFLSISASASVEGSAAGSIVLLMLLVLVLPKLGTMCPQMSEDRSIRRNFGKPLPSCPFRPCPRGRCPFVPGLDKNICRALAVQSDNEFVPKNSLLVESYVHRIEKDMYEYMKIPNKLDACTRGGGDIQQHVPRG